MAQKIMLGIVALIYSNAGFALDLEREHLLDLYHDVDNEQSVSTSSTREWVNLSAGIAPSYEDDFSDIEFSPLQEEKTTQFGVFSGELEESNATDSGFTPSTPTQFGQSEDERYGVFIKQRF